jgi:hypothetical protein
MSLPSALVLLVSLAGSARSQDAPTRVAHPWTVTDAVVGIPDVTVRVRILGDVDGDSHPDLAVQRTDAEGVWQIDAVSAETGKTLWPIWKAPERAPDLATWEAGGDLDGDGWPDLLVSLIAPAGGRSMRAGQVFAISATTGEELHECRGENALDRFGACLAFLGDVDGDGHDDYVVGGPQCDDQATLSDEFVVTGIERSTYNGIPQPTRLSLGRGGRSISLDDYWKLDAWGEELEASSERPGYVSARSGRDGSELWRATGFRRGHGFGSTVTAAGDWNGDGYLDVLVQSHPRSREPVVVLSGRYGSVLDCFDHRAGHVIPIGDLNGDGLPDLAMKQGCSETTGLALGDLLFVSGANHEVLFENSDIEVFSDWGSPVALGDVDADGRADFGIADADYHLGGPGDPGWDGDRHDETPVDVRTLALRLAVAIPTEAWCAFTWESGRVIVYSGKTLEPIAGVWGEPGGRGGMGLQVESLPDVTGDGWRDLLVRDEAHAFVFAGPGPRED